MKSFVTAMIIFSVMILSGIAFDICLGNMSGQLMDGCKEISDKIDGDNLQEAFADTKKLSEYIDGEKGLLSSILDHSSIDEIEKEISELLGYTEQNDKTEAAVSVKKLQHMFEHLPENYALALQNIL